MKQSKQPSTRKPPALSAEEELAELLADPTLKPSINFLGLRDITTARVGQATISVPDTDTDHVSVSVPDTETDVKPDAIIFNREHSESVSGTASVPDTVPVSGTAPVPDTDTVPLSSPKPVLVRKPQAGPAEETRSNRYQPPKPKQALTAEEGHSHSEQHLYEALWNAGEVRDRDSRVVQLGFGAMSRLARLSLNNCRLNIRSLVRKLAIEEIGGPQCEQQVGKTYLIHSPAAILRRRKTAGLEWVVRTKGVVFVDPTSGAVLTDPVTPNGASKEA